jgi:hypothetical protein
MNFNHGKLVVAVVCALASCKVTQTKTTETEYDCQGRVTHVTETCETELTTADGVTASGSFSFGPGSISFELDNGKKSVCTPKTPNAMGDAKAALEGCTCKETGSDGDEVDAVAPDDDDGGEAGDCGGGDVLVDETECSYELTQAEWDCEEV